MVSLYHPSGSPPGGRCRCRDARRQTKRSLIAGPPDASRTGRARCCPANSVPAEGPVRSPRVSPGRRRWSERHRCYRATPRATGPPLPPRAACCCRDRPSSAPGRSRFPGSGPRRVAPVARGRFPRSTPRTSSRPALLRRPGLPRSSRRRRPGSTRPNRSSSPRSPPGSRIPAGRLCQAPVLPIF